MRRPLFWLALVCHVVLASAYALRTASFEGPDENSHYEYAQHLANARSLPLAPFLAQQRGLPQTAGASLAHHPPLYYALLAAVLVARGSDDTVFGPLLNPDFGKPGISQHLKFLHGGDEYAPISDGEQELRLLRLVSVLLGAISLWCVHRLGLLALPEQPCVADVATLLVACLPMWSFLHGVLNSDVLATTLSCAAVLALARLLTRDRATLPQGCTIGVLLGLALLTKLTTLFLLPLTAVAFAVVAWQRPAQRRALARTAACTLVLAAAISGWWFWRNHVLYGDVLAMNVHDAAFQPIPQELRWQWFFGGFLPQVFTSLLGCFGWFILPPPRFLVWIGIAATAGALLGGALLLRERRQRTLPRPCWLLLATCVLVFAGTAKFNLSAPQPQGRLLFPAVAPAAVLFAAGLLRCGQLLRLTKVARWLAALPPLLAALVLLLVAPVFAPDRVFGSSPYHAALVGHIVGDVDNPTLRWHDLPATANTPPLLQWDAPAAEPAAAPYTLYAYDHRGRVWLATYEWSHGQIALQNGAPLPASAWDLLPRGVDLLLKLRRVPDWFHGERLAAMPTSAPQPFRRE